MTRDPSTETRQTLVVEMTGEPNDVYRYQQILIREAWNENRDTARVFGKTLYIFQKHDPKA